MTRTDPTETPARAAAGTPGFPHYKKVLTALAAVSILGATGCAGAEAPAAQAPSSEQPASEAPAQTPAAGGPTAGGSAGEAYKDGTYTGTGNYQSPAGQEEVGVTLTLEADVVTAVEVTPMPDNPTTTEYQGRFAGGISDAVVGKKLDELAVDKVAGSSLTSGGFNDALGTIKSEAQL